MPAPTKKIKGERLWFSSDRLKLLAKLFIEDNSPQAVVEFLKNVSKEELTELIFDSAIAAGTGGTPIYIAPELPVALSLPDEPIETSLTLSTEIDDDDLDVF